MKVIEMLKAIKKRFQKQINQFADFYFGDKFKPKPKRDIAVGDIFILGQGKEEKDPFKREERRKDPSKVKILAIQEGYVQYEYFPPTIWSPDSMKIDTFLYVYRKK